MILKNLIFNLLLIWIILIVIISIIIMIIWLDKIILKLRRLHIILLLKWFYNFRRLKMILWTIKRLFDACTWFQKLLIIIGLIINKIKIRLFVISWINKRIDIINIYRRFYFSMLTLPSVTLIKVCARKLLLIIFYYHWRISSAIIYTFQMMSF